MAALAFCTACAWIIIVNLINYSCNGFVKTWSEQCNFTAECADHRFVCSEDENTGLKTCECDRFHEWKGEEIGCFPKFNVSTIISMVTTISNTAEELAKTTEIVFKMQAIAGFFVFGMVLLSSLSVLIYCFYIKRKDNLLKLEIQELLKAKNKPTRSAAIV